MPSRSKKSEAAKQREAKKAETARGDPAKISPNDNPRRYEYQPTNPECQPYWDEFYVNPYPSKKECKIIAERLGSTVATIWQWFKMARQYTHAPDRWPDSDEEDIENGGAESEGGYESDAFEDAGVQSIKGTLYEHFYRKTAAKTRGTKRGRSSTLVADGGVVQSAAIVSGKKTKTVAHHYGPRGPETGNSRTTRWRHRKHAEKHCSDIRKFFPSVGSQAKEASCLSDVATTESGSDSELELIEHKSTSSVHSEMYGTETSAPGKSPLLEEDGELSDNEGLDTVKYGIEVCHVPTEVGFEAAHVDEEDFEQHMTIDEYQRALALLETSMNELKLNLQAPDEGLGGQTVELDPAAPTSGPTLKDAAAVIQESKAQLDNDNDEGEQSFHSNLNRYLQQLLNEEKKSKSPNVKNLIELTTLSDYNNLRESYRKAGYRAPSTQASNKIAEAKFIPTAEKPKYRHESWYARRLRAKANHIVRFGCLPATKQGQGATHRSLLAREDVRRNILSYLRTLKVGAIGPLKLRREVNQNILPELGIESPICENTARAWLERLGFRRAEHRKGMYMDGHERSDVVEYRQEFLRKIKLLLPLMQQYDDETDKPLPLELPPGQKRHVAVAHDECCFHANDRQTHSYLRNGEQQLRQKGRGRVVHVSDFITEEFGRLALPLEMVEENKKLPIGKRLLVTDARKTIEPGKNHDKWWDMDQLCEQLFNAIKIFNRLHPNCVAVFFFDQSSAHGAFAEDALVVRRMNVTPGGKNAKPMHATIIPMDNPHSQLRGKPQSMIFEAGHPNAGQPKGMRAVLEERGLLDTLDRRRGSQPVGTCGVCRQSDEARAKAEREARERMEEDPELYRSFQDAGLDEEHPQQQARSATCCMQRCLSLQQDFLDEKPRIQLIIEQAGHICIFLPKFHCELNPIEMYWGYAKRLFRDSADGTITTARKLVPECLNECSTRTIRHFWRKSWRYMDAYMVGLTGKEAENAVKKYKSHRRVQVTKKMIEDA